MGKIIEKVKSNPKKSAAAGVGLIAALFTLLETTGWGLLTHEQHQAILTFFGAII